MTNDGSNTITYDAENRAITSSGSLGSGTYTYDGNNLRVKKLSSSTTTVYVFSGSRVLAEYVNGAAPTSPTREYIYSGSTLLAKVESGATQYYHSDHLSTRLMTNSSGTKIGEQGHYPFGESWYLTNTTTKWQFTDYERDSESGNDYAYARIYVNRLARFSALDPLSGDVSDPQTLDRYAYGRNDPLNLIDPTGMELCEDDDTCGGDGAGGGGFAAGSGATGNGGSAGNPNGCPIPTDTPSVCNHPAPPSEPGILDTTNSGVNAADGPGTLGGSGGGGGVSAGGGGRDVAGSRILKLVRNVVKKICSVVPSGLAMSAGGGTGAIGSPQGSANVVMNFDTGHTSLYFTGGGQLGWNGGVSGYVSGGYVFSSSNFSPTDYSGKFSTWAGSSSKGPGGFISNSTDGKTTVVGTSMGGSFYGPPGGFSLTNTTAPITNYLTEVAGITANSALAGLGTVLTIARSGCTH